jgi:hypothetical protein
MLGVVINDDSANCLHLNRRDFLAPDLVEGVSRVLYHGTVRNPQIAECGQHYQFDQHN